MYQSSENVNKEKKSKEDMFNITYKQREDQKIVL